MPTTVEVFVERRPSRAGSTDEAAFADLYARTYSSLVAYCRRYCPPGYDAEDIAQEAFSRAWTSWDRYSPSRPFWPWVATIARRLCVDYWRRDERSAARDGRAAVLEPQTSPCPDEMTETAEECRLAVGAFRRLRPDHQRIVGLRDIEGWSYEDIARFEGVTVESVRGSLRRARVSLRKSYEHMARGVPVVFILDGLLDGFRRARGRVTARLTELQGHATRTGASSAGVAEWLVTVVAMAVAVSGLGAPGNPTPAPVAPVSSAPAATESDNLPPAPGPGAAGADTSPGGGATRANSPAPAPSDLAGEFGPPPALLGPPTSPDELIVSSVVASPRYEHDGTVFASGRGFACAACYALFKSEDRGRTWKRLSATGLASESVFLPPAFGAGDDRIFASNGAMLQVSTNGGESFDVVAPAAGGAAMSPEFSAGDPRILFSASPVWEYDDPSGTVTPLALAPPPRSNGGGFALVFASDYRTSRAIYLGASDAVVDHTQGAAVYRCVGNTCSAGTPVPGGMTPNLFAPKGAGSTVYAWNEVGLFRSTDGASSFQPVDFGLDRRYEMVRRVTEDAAGRLYVVLAAISPDNSYASRVLQSSDGGGTWSELHSLRAPGIAVDALVALPDGRLVITLAGTRVGLRCSTDGGRSWARRCA